MPEGVSYLPEGISYTPNGITSERDNLHTREKALTHKIRMSYRANKDSFQGIQRFQTIKGVLTHQRQISYKP